MARGWMIALIGLGALGGVGACVDVLGLERAVPARNETPPEGGSEASPPGADGGCGDVLQNPKHCGRCGHDCLGGSCRNGVCLSFPVAAYADVSVDAIAVDATTLYVAVHDASGSRLLGCSKGGCSAEAQEVVSQQTRIQEVLASDNAIYWLSDAELCSCSKSPPCEPLCSTSHDFFVNAWHQLALVPGFTRVLATRVLHDVAEPARHRIVSVRPTAPRDEMTLFSSSTPISAARIAGDTLLWLAPSYLDSTTAVVTCPLAGCRTPRTHVAGLNLLVEAHVWEGTLYVADPERIRSCALPQCELETLYTHPTPLLGSVRLNVDAENLYFTSNGGLAACPRQRCAEGLKVIGPVSDATSSGGPVEMVGDVDSIYWRTKGADRVFRVARP